MIKLTQNLFIPIKWRRDKIKKSLSINLLQNGNNCSNLIKAITRTLCNRYLYRTLRQPSQQTLGGGGCKRIHFNTINHAIMNPPKCDFAPSLLMRMNLYQKSIS